MSPYFLVLPLALIASGILLVLFLRRVPLTSIRLGWLLALFPLMAFVSLLFLNGQIPPYGAVIFSVPWIPALGLNFSLYLDGLSSMFALMVTGIGILVVIYTGYYFTDSHPAAAEHKPESHTRFFAYILLFMLAMLGLVLAGDLITLFIFWEATSISSFLLIAYKYKDEAARKGAFKSLFITGGGGIAMLAGFLFVINISGSAEYTTILSSGDVLRSSPLYPVFFALIAFGAFTKSAQFPAHIWLPDAMNAPTPASAFLHSATMVTAGIYLLARLNPSLGNTDTWFWTLSIFGLTTMLAGAYLGVKQNDLKALLAYSTISQLGVMVALIGQDTEIAFKALVISVIAHALYKSSLFMTAGIVDHETGTRDLRKLGGLRKQMPIMFGIASIAALSMAGLPPLFGFLSKETLLASATHPSLPPVVDRLFPLTIVIAGALILVQAGILVWDVFLGKPADPKHPPHGHDPKWGFWLAPAIPALLSLMVGILPEPKAFASFLAAAAEASYGAKVKVSLAMWTGINVPLLLSIVAVTLGLVLFWQRNRIRPRLTNFLPNLSFNAVYDGTLFGLDWLSRAAIRLQGGKLRVYLSVILLSMVGLVVLFSNGLERVLNPQPLLSVGFEGLNLLRLSALAILVASALASILLRSDLHAIIALSVSGLGVAVWIALEPAPDVALAQVVVDILATVILILSLSLIPRAQRLKAMEFTHQKSRPGLLKDALVAGLAGLVVMGATFIALNTRPRESVVTPFYVENAKPLTGAKDIEGAIVVDFRAADTLMEILVFSLAALGIYSLLHYATRKAGVHDHESSSGHLPAHSPLGIHDLPTSPFLHTLAYVVLPLALVLGITHMMYGHDQPGDGFTAGIIISLAIALWYMLFGYYETRRKLSWLNRNTLIASGLTLALVNALGGAVFGDGVLSLVDYGKMLGLPLPPGFYLTNSFLFEVAICLTVLGAATLILDNLGHPREDDPEAEAELESIGE